MEPTLHLNEFFVEGSNPDDSHVLLNITEPSTPEEKSKGYFFAICEINNADSKYIEKVQKIIDEVENNYYEVPDQEDKSSLEIILDKVNHESFSLLREGVTLNCIVGAIRRTELIFSFYGNPQMILFYKTKEEIYKRMDLVAENMGQEASERHQLFSQIIQGKIGQNDYFFAGTPHIVDYFNHDRLQKIITTRPARQSAEHLQRVLSELKNNFSFGGIIIHIQKGEDDNKIRISPIKKGDSAKSLRHLFSTEKQTASILSPSILPKLQDRMEEKQRQSVQVEEMQQNFSPAEINSSHMRPRQTMMRARTENANGVSVLDVTRKIFSVIWIGLKYLAKGIAWIAIILGTLMAGIGRNLLLLFFVITNIKKRRQNILADWSRKWRNFKDNIVRLPLATKILFGASIVLVLVFTGSVVVIKSNQKKAEREKAFAGAIQTIKTKKDSAESSIVYNDNAAALSEIKSAKEILASLECAEEKKAQCDGLNDEMENLLLRIRKITVVEPQKLTDWTELIPGAQINGLFQLNNKIYGYGLSSTFFVYDPMTKESRASIAGINVNGFSAAAVPKENDYATLVYSNKEFAQLNPKDGVWKKIDAGFPISDVNVSAITVYNRRLYSFDAQNDMLYKHDGTKSGFAQGKEWIKTKVDIDDGVDLAIDGDIFILGKNGAVYKFTNGLIQTFAIEGLDPPLTSADRIWTYTDLNYLYILDSVGKRLIILDKTGTLKSQITAAEFVKPTGMIVDEVKGTAYIVDNNKLYQIGLQ